MDIDVIDEFGPEYVSEFQQLYKQYPWWKGRTLEDVRTMIEQTDVLVGLREIESGTFVAAGRVLTDFVYYAKIYDVIVAETRRGEGLGRELMRAIVTHPALSSLSAMTLDCREGLVSFYEECGFESHKMEVDSQDGPEELVPMIYRIK